MTNFQRSFLLALCVLLAVSGTAQMATAYPDIGSRQITNLDGRWQQLVDPYMSGTFDYRAQPLKSNGAFLQNHKPQNESELSI